MTKALAPKWDLSDFYKGIADPAIKRDKKRVDQLSQSFVKAYKGKINSPKLNAKILAKALKDLEKIYVLLDNYSAYASLIHSTDTVSHKVGKFYQDAREYANKIYSQLLWFELEWLTIPSTTAERLIADPILLDYKHYLAHSRVFKPFTLPESEEVIITKKSQTGRSAFVRLYDEIDANMVFYLKLKGKNKKLSYSQIVNYIGKDSDRKVRQNASLALTKGLKLQEKTFSFILNTLLLDKKVSDEIRGYKTPQEATLLSYEIDPSIVDALTATTQKYYYLCERFYKAKSKLLKLPVIHEWDRYSSLYPNRDKNYSWDSAKNLVLSSFASFSQDFHRIAKEFFDNNWIDAAIYNGKTSGAYCSYTTPLKHPLVLLNFEGRSRDVSTLAHELGHAIHAELGKNHSYFEFDPSPHGEIASIFAESIVFDDLLNNTKDPYVKANLLADKFRKYLLLSFARQHFIYLNLISIKRERDLARSQVRILQGFSKKGFRPCLAKDSRLHLTIPIGGCRFTIFSIITFMFLPILLENYWLLHCLLNTKMKVSHLLNAT